MKPIYVGMCPCNTIVCFFFLIEEKGKLRITLNQLLPLDPEFQYSDVNWKKWNLYVKRTRAYWHDRFSATSEIGDLTSFKFSVCSSWEEVSDETLDILEQKYRLIYHDEPVC